MPRRGCRGSPGEGVPPGDSGVVYNGKGPQGLVLQGDAVVEDKETEAKWAKVFAKKPVPTVNPIANEESKPRRTKQAKKWSTYPTS